jgi:hypothetical protein
VDYHFIAERGRWYEIGKRMMNREMMEMDIERKFGVAVSLALEFTTAIWHLVLNWIIRKPLNIANRGSLSMSRLEFGASSS